MAFGSLTQWWCSFLARATKTLVNVRKTGHYDEENTAHLGNACWKENIWHGFLQEIFFPNPGWRRSATNFELETAATQNQSYIVDGKWTLLTTECANSLGQKFSRFIGELQRYSLDIHVCLVFSMCLRNDIRCSNCSVPPLRWMYDQLSD